MPRRWAGVAGIAVAWAGLIKLFPFILILPAGARLLRAKLRRGRKAKGEGVSRWSIVMVAWCAPSVFVLGLAALLGGRSWADFLQKIVVQFQSKGYLLNSVSLSQWLLTLGIHLSPVPGVISAAALAAPAAMFMRDEDGEFMASLPRRSLVLIAATGYLVQTWFNY